jgi:CheY-like chemotaxis protein
VKTLRVLVIDGLFDQGQVVSVLLRQRYKHASVYMVPSVDDAEKLLSFNQFDLIISDYQMSGRDGLEIARFLLTHLKNTPLIYFTGVEIPRLRLEQLNYPVTVIIKPDHNKLLAVASDILSKISEGL